ncbi:MAG TPA: VanW family protein [Solirubrobacterales bacterium]|nr:VanW family protein [Solirubrobacterales bacterium]
MQADRERRRRERESRPSPGLSRFRGSKRTFWLFTVGGVVVVWVLSGFLIRAFSSGEVLNGTAMSGVQLGGLSRERAADRIADMPPRQVELLRARETFDVRTPQAGLVVDVDGSADRAYEAGRSGVGDILKGPLVPLLNRDLEPAYDPVNTKRLNRTVNRIADKLDREPFVGALSIDPDTLAVTIEQPKAGVRVRRTATEAMLLDTFRDGGDSMEIPVRRQPAPSPAEVQAVARDAERYLQSPVRIETAGGPATFTPQEIAGVLAVESAGEEPDAGIRLGADTGKVESLVADFAGSRDKPARDAAIDAPALPPVNLSEQGDLSWQPKPGAAGVKPDRVGREIRQRQAVENLTGAIRDGEHRVRFPTERVVPEVTTGEVKNASSLLGTFTTSFPCCEPRVTNIQRMAETVDGTVIGPGEQFSLNGVAGERTRANGYKPAPTIGEGNTLVDSVGGGVSQFSTTLYNAAYFAGLQIDSHTPHSFYISRYPPGRESTLSFGSIDLLWTNDTDAPVVVRSSASDTAVTVSIYGGNGGRKVKAETQSRSDTGKGGFDITIDRVIVYGDGTRAREPFTTSYGVPAE